LSAGFCLYNWFDFLTPNSGWAEARTLLTSMKRCPTCDKTFDDNMRFCQADGTPLIEDAPVDPYKTMVARPEDFAAAKSSSQSDDVLDLPSADDPAKTMFASEDEIRREMAERDEQVIDIPPLRARQGDAALLAHGFVRKFGLEQRRNGMALLPDAVQAIDSHQWPGNVRELENVIKRAVIMADGLGIGASDVGLGSDSAEPNVLNLRQVREEAEKHAVLRVLGRVNGNLSKAAEMLGVSRPTLYDLMHRFGLK